MNRQSLFWVTLCVILGLGINIAQAGPGIHAVPVVQPAPFGQVNTYYANSPSGVWVPDPTVAIPNVAPSDSGTPLRKFVDSLPGLGPLGANNLGNYIPVANKGTNPVAGDPADYYEIELVDYRQKMHSDLPGTGTKLRGYRDLTPAGNSSPARYLGPLIIAKSFNPLLPANLNGNGAPVRIKFKNSLANGAAGNLFIPVDTTAMGAGLGPLSKTWDPVGLTLVPTGNTEMYTQNRAELHLHGGVTPWISDGTPHQWFTPAGEVTSYKRGVSQQNVPDMPDPGDGYATYYYSNQQSARLMFYHDHAYGLTRLNVYAGEAAGYLLYDQTELDLISGTNVSGNNFSLAKVLPDNGGGLYTFGIPLIIQDKTFVPKDVAVQDAKWTNPQWGTYGDLWYPHVYEPNQNPNDASGANPYGRWDYGPWFWPPVAIPAVYAALPSAGANNAPSLTPEAFMDTPIVNGEAYPYLPVEPKAYRFRILNAANDRPFNLQTYVSDPTSAGNFIQGGYPTEVAMVPSAPHPACTVASIAATPTVPSTCTCTATYAPLGCFPANWPADGRAGGVPDPQFAGPKMIQIGTEGGFLPSPAVLDNQPLGYEYNRRNIVVLDVLYKTLLLGPAERADVIIDFSAYAGKTVILYNDAPAPNPAFDTRYDYFTNSPDQTNQGGAPSTLAGYGPNTRTIMQFRVAASTAAPFTVNMPALTTAVQKAFTATQPAPIVPEPDYAANYPASPSPNLITPIYSTIFDNSLTFTPLAGGAPQTVNFLSKAIQELWDPWGRMNATLGVELPKTTNTIQTTIPFGYADPITENVDNNVIQMWKITHNGVDTHPVHFHLFDVQLINRVGWDGAIRPPDPNEVGWKETVKMKPLEDVVVALRPIMPALPFGIPTSTRLQDPTLPAGAQNTGLAGFFDGTGAGFMGLNPVDGTPITVTNALTSYGHEYVWHCHILGHEENDFMRPLVLSDASAIPATPTLAATLGSGTSAGAIRLTWNDATPPTVANMGNPKNEIGFHIYRCAPVAPSTTCTPTTLLYTALANSTSYTDQKIAQNTRYRYNIAAFTAIGQSGYSNTTSSILTPATLPPYVSITAPTNLAKFAQGSPITITANASAATGQTITRVDFYSGASLIGTDSTAPYSFTWAPAAVGTYSLTARAYDNHGTPQTTTSAIVSISVVSLATSITAPATGASFNLGVAIPITATATTVTGLTVTMVEFYDGASLLGASNGPAFSYNWTTAAAGAHTLTSKAYYNNGSSVTSAPITVDVVATTIATPLAGAAFNLGVAIPITANVATVAGLTVNQVAFYADAVLIGTSTIYPYTYTWNGATGNVHTLTATATYSNAVTAPSPPVSIVVLSSAITAPAGGSSSTLGVPVPITASVPVVTGINVTKVDFYAGATLVGTSTALPYTVSWNPAAAGAYNLTATATFSNLATATSPMIAVTVLPNVAITSPASGAASDLGAPIAFAASAAAPAGSITILVEYYADAATTPFGYSFVAPYNYSWTTATAGTHNLTAKAYYSNGTTSTSAVVPVTVNGTVIAPASITVPATSSTGSYPVSWAASTTVGVTYTLEESTDNFATYPANSTVVTSGLTALTAAITGKTNGTYSYRVKAVKAPMADSAWVSGQCVVLLPPLAPTAIAPTGLGVGTTAAFTFTGVSNVTQYVIWLQDYTAATGGPISFIPAQAGCNVGTACSYTPVTPLTALHSYGWAVVASNTSGPGPWSTTLNFSVVAAPAALTPLTPVGPGVGTTAAFTFTGDPNATQYSIWLQDYTTATGGPVSFTSAQAGCAVGTACSYTPPTPLTALHSYGWSVMGSNASGSGPWSTSLNFSVVAAPAALTPLTPVGPGVATTTAFAFTGDANATQYMIWLQDYTTATGGPIVFTPTQAGCAAGTACSYAPVVTPLTTLHSYGWAVMGSNASGSGPWSTSLNFVAQ